MKNIILTFLVFTVTLSTLQSQVKYENFKSLTLNRERQLKIQMPRGYNSNEDKTYPLILVLDGDYMFESVAGNADYFAYWEDMPEAIVIGINQFDYRDKDCYYSKQNSLPIDTGRSFYEFIRAELLPHIKNQYRTSGYKIIVGHGETANFINNFLIKPQPLFNSYISISPNLAPNMAEYLKEAVSKIPINTFYYLAQTNNDSKANQEKVSALNTVIKGSKNDKLIYYFNSFEGPSHYTISAHAIPDAFERIFKIYQPISKREFKEVVLKLSTSPVEYLTGKYKAIEDLFGIRKQIIINDFNAIAAAIEKNKEFKYYEELGKLARKEHPKTILGSYYLARFYEETGEPKKAVRTYQSAYTLEEVGRITKDLVLEKADLLKKDFGIN